jgi:hypothetical protein
MKPLPDQPPKEDYVLNQQYLSGAEQSRLRPPVRDDDSDAMPGGFPATGNIVRGAQVHNRRPL